MLTVKITTQSIAKFVPMRNFKKSNKNNDVYDVSVE